MEQKIITVHGKNYKIISEMDKECTECSFKDNYTGCMGASAAYLCGPNNIIFQEPLVRPPIGIIPLVNHNTMRLNALMDTLQRYAEAGSPAKPQWVQEVKSLIEYERSLTSEALAKVPFKL